MSNDSFKILALFIKLVALVNLKSEWSELDFCDWKLGFENRVYKIKGQIH